MPSGSLAVISFLALGYLLFVVELVVPGGILGILGALSVIYGCYLAFDLGFVWGTGSILASVAFFAAGVYFVLKSKTGRHLTLADENDGPSWKSADQTLVSLLGAEGVASTQLRPAGVAHFGERRVDVVTDNRFLARGTAIRVVEVEGSRVVVEAVEDDPEPEASDDETPPGENSWDHEI